MLLPGVVLVVLFPVVIMLFVGVVIMALLPDMLLPVDVLFCPPGDAGSESPEHPEMASVANVIAVSPLVTASLYCIDGFL